MGPSFEAKGTRPIKISIGSISVSPGMGEYLKVSMICSSVAPSAIALSIASAILALTNNMGAATTPTPGIIRVNHPAVIDPAPLPNKRHIDFSYPSREGIISSENLVMAWPASSAPLPVSILSANSCRSIFLRSSSPSLCAWKYAWILSSGPPLTLPTPCWGGKLDSRICPVVSSTTSRRSPLSTLSKSLRSARLV